MSEKVLIVEDDPGYLALLKLRLGKAGFDVETAEGGAAAKAAFSKSPAPVVVTDLVMPEVNGADVLRFVKAHRPKTAVILLSGKGTIEQAVAAMRDGAFDFLVKPVEAGKLERVVRYCFEMRSRFSERRGANANRSETEMDAVFSLMPDRLNDCLTKSEIRVVALVLRGKTDQEIADKLFVSYHTVKKHLQNMFKKMAVKNRVELILALK